MSVDQMKRVVSLFFCAATLSAVFCASHVAAQEQPSEEPDPGTETDGEGETEGEGETDPDSGDALECSWPEELNPGSEAPQVCTAWAAQLRCSDDDGRLVFCSSNDGVTCAPNPNTPDLQLSNCASVCEPNEYFVNCSSAPGDQLPASCDSIPPFPGISWKRYCCPCE